MTAVAPKSSLVTAHETRLTAAPSLLTPLTFGGRLRSIIAVTAVAAADSDADIFYVSPVYSSWRIDEMPTKCTAITGATAYELGLYSVTAAFVTAVIDIDCYATAQDFSTAINKLPVDLKSEAVTGNTTLDLASQAVWQDPTGGASTDPKAWYYLAYTATTAGTGAGTIATAIHYVDGT